MPDPLQSARLELVPFSAPLVEAMLAGDHDRLFDVVAARFSGGIVPPLLEDHLEELLQMLHGDPEKATWCAWLSVDRTLGEAVGSAGIGLVPDRNGHVLMGWAVFPSFERQGYATEAAAAVAEWAIARPGVTAVRATVPPWNTPSIRVAQKIGMKAVGNSEVAEVGEVIVFEYQRA